MKKNLLALAVAGAFAAPAAALAQGSFVQIYGTINSDLQGAEAEGGAPLPIGATGPTSFGANYGITGGTPATVGTNGFAIRPTGVNSQGVAVRDVAFTQISNQAGLSSNSSNIGFRGSEDLGNGLKAIFQIESSINIDTGAGGLGSRNSNVGLSSNWGTVFYGLWDTPYKNITLKADPFFATSAAVLQQLDRLARFQRPQRDFLRCDSPRTLADDARTGCRLRPSPGQQRAVLDAELGRVLRPPDLLAGRRQAELRPGQHGRDGVADCAVGPVDVGRLAPVRQWSDLCRLGVRAAQGLLRHPRADRLHRAGHGLGRLGRENRPGCAESLGLQRLRLLRAAGVRDRWVGDVRVSSRKRSAMPTVDS